MAQVSPTGTCTHSVPRLLLTFILVLSLVIFCVASILTMILLSKSNAFAQTACHLRAPANPYSGKGLETPWILQAGCSESNPNDEVFLQAIIFDPATRSLSVYEPLVIDAGTVPAAAPVPVAVPAGAVVGIFGGGNGGMNVVNNKSCVSMLYQVFYCNTYNLFSEINHYHIHVPVAGVDSHGQPCPTVRSFRIVDQDPSDNVTSTYLLTASGQTAQNNSANQSALAGASIIYNGSDNALLAYVDQAIGCTPFLLPDLSNNGTLVPSQGADELLAAASDGKALIPAGDPMVAYSLLLLNEYRVSVDQPAVRTLGQANTQSYCSRMIHDQSNFLSSYKTTFQNTPAPPFAGGGNLYDFLNGRLTASIQLLHCNAKE